MAMEKRDYVIIGYVMNHSLPSISEEDVRLLTHINLAFGLIKDGLLDLSQLTNINAIKQFREWNPNLKIVLSVGGWGAGGFSEMAMTAEGRRKFALSCLEAVQSLRLDGIDIDWEYPNSGAAGIAYDPRDRENFTLLLQTLRNTLGCNKIVSIAAGAGEYFIRNTQMDRVAEICDYVQLMTYDMRTGTQAGHHAALGSTEGDTPETNTRHVVNIFHEAGVPYSKIVIGIAWYSHIFYNVNNANNGLLQQAESSAFGPTFGQITPEYIRDNGFTEYWDPEAEAGYLWNGKDFVSYETERAVIRKCEYVKRQGLRGVMYWEHGHDPSRTLLRAIYKTLKG